MNVPSRRTLLAALVGAVPSVAAAQGSLLNEGRSLLNTAPGCGSSGKGAALSQGEIGSGLKDALKVASQRVVGRVGKPDGYNGDPTIRIPLPDPLQKIEGPLKSVGAGGMLADLQTRMNRAAEQAAPKALAIFTDAVSKMSITDARSILTGPQDAATQYFKRTTTASLTTSFRPIVDKSLSSVGAVSAFKSVRARASSVPFAGQEVQSFNLTDFTVGKALDGLFHYMSVEEAAIRTNPAARTTDLLKKVFG
ncbi:MAG TPA: DUF4197 domain-containing protein [Stellaceae bacterium]|nr:DUF4197 domain-containing protein [Stellaceae bacterium]